MTPALTCPFIRGYNPSTDEAAMMHICRVTAHPSAQHEPTIAIVPYIFALPYVRVFPEYTFVLDSGSGNVVGYIVGVPDSKEYLARYKSDYLPQCDRHLLPEPGTEKAAKFVTSECSKAMLRRLYSPDESLLHPQLPTLLENFPAHLHIDILPEYQGKGRGRALMNAFIAKLRENGVKGIHLIKAVENTASEIFYSKVGFSRYGGVMDGGESGELARISGGRVCMVRKL